LLWVSQMPSNHHILHMIKAWFDHLRTARAPWRRSGTLRLLILICSYCAYLLRGTKL
jgi:hypothetical protein